MKKVVFMFLALILSLVTVTSSTLAATVTKAEISNRLDAMSNENGFEIFIDETGELEKKVGELIKVDSLEQMEQIIKEFNAIVDKTETNMYQLRDQNDLNISSVRNAIERIEQWDPIFVFGFNLSKTNTVEVKYQYETVPDLEQYERFVDIESVTSYLQGSTVGVTWEQTNYAENYYPVCTLYDGVDIQVNGKYVLGFEYEGFPVGSVKSDTWNVSFELNEL